MCACLLWAGLQRVSCYATPSLRAYKAVLWETAAGGMSTELALRYGQREREKEERRKARGRG